MARSRRIEAMSDRLSRASVVHVAMLARLALTDDELDRMTADLDGILDHAQDVASLDTAGVAPTAHPIALVNVFRPDVVRPGVDRDEVLACAPVAEDRRFRVPNILGGASPTSGQATERGSAS